MALSSSVQGLNLLDTPHLALMGPPISNGVAGGTYWYGNTVRLPLSENFWLYGYSTQNCTSAQYQGLVKSTVDALTSLKLNVILSLHWTDAGGQYSGRGAGFEMPDNDSVIFWTQVAKIFSGYSNVFSNYSMSRILIHTQSRIRISGHVGKAAVKLRTMTPLRAHVIVLPRMRVLACKRSSIPFETLALTI